MRKVAFLSNNVTIHGTLCIPQFTNSLLPGVIIFHGMTSSEDSYVALAELLAKHGMAALAISMRGHGESGGDFTMSTVDEAIADGLAAYDFLTNQTAVDVDRIGLLGSSVGAT
jgi:dienelactone hydrolase